MPVRRQVVDGGSPGGGADPVSAGAADGGRDGLGCTVGGVGGG